MKQNYCKVRGTHDFSPQETIQFNAICQTSRDILRAYGYQEIILPVLEDSAVFSRSAGETSDIVEKQMFKVVSRCQDDQSTVVLRPEGTAQVIRYFLENSLHNQSDFYKFCYFGPMFRGERPQKGRLRQFNHIGVEALGANNPLLDSEIVILAWTILESLGVKEKEIKINSLGCVQDKQKFAEFLTQSLQAKQQSLCPDCQRRLEKNPLRVIDCKRPECKAAIAGLEINDKHLCPACKDDFALVLKMLDTAKVKYTYSPHLVRGLDYYTNTVFEITSSALGSQDAIGAGGRYNNLIETMGGLKFPAVGFALGVERVMLVLGSTIKSQALDVYVVITDQKFELYAAEVIAKLRQSGVSADMDFMKKSMKAQMRNADKRSSRFVAIIGEEEAKQNSVMLKNMQSAAQELVKSDEIIRFLK